MRVVFDHQVFAFQTYGGISRYFVRLAEAINGHAGHSARIVAPVHVNAYLGELPPGSVRGFRIGATDFNRKVARNVARRVAAPMIAAERPDIVHETYFAAKGSAPRGVPTVLTVYDMIHEIFADSYHPDDQTRALKRAAVRRADHVLCISASTERDLIAHIPEAAGKTSVVLLGFDSFAAPVGSEAPPERPYLLYVGERTRYKNFTGLLRAYANAQRLHSGFDLVCFGGGAVSADERAAISELGLDAARLHFRAGDDALLARTYRGASAFIYPSLYEGFGIPPLEAMSSGCPVIAANVSSIPEVCGDAAAYFDPASPDAIAAAIEAVVFDSARSADLVARGRLRLGAFSWAHCADATLATYRALL
jgi:glycosyltransferase involved in cell wall biosynthesis